MCHCSDNLTPIGSDHRSPQDAIYPEVNGRVRRPRIARRARDQVDADRTIIVVEPLGQRRDLALSLGATHVVNPASEPLLQRVAEIAPGGVDYVLDTASVADVLQQTMPALAHRARVGIVGLPSDRDTALRLNLTQVLTHGIRVIGILLGDSQPDLFIPYLLDLHRAGRFPFDRLITTMPFSQINEAVSAQLRGEAVKIVLVPE